MHAGLQNRSETQLPVTMTESGPIPVRTKVAAYRAKQSAAGMLEVNAYMPADLVAEIDKVKKERGATSRAPIIEEAVRFYFENNRA